MNLSVIIKNLLVSIVLTIVGVSLINFLHPGLFDKGVMAALTSFDAVLIFVLIFISGILGSLFASSSVYTGDAEQSGDTAQGQRDSGQVKWFNASKGFGFITRDDGVDVFVHYRSIRGEGRKTLYEDQKVLFDTREGEKGLQAEDVEIISRR